MLNYDKLYLLHTKMNMKTLTIGKKRVRLKLVMNILDRFPKKTRNVVGGMRQLW